MSSATAAAAPQSSTQAKQQVWLITGCSQGLGYELSKAVLAAGHKVVASSRQPTRTPEVVAEIEKLGGSWVKLDVASGEVELEVQVEKALAVYGRVDVLVNNAGVGMAGAVEDFSMAQTRTMFETNFFGPLRLIQLLTPHFRTQAPSGGSTIVNISSAATWRAMPGITLYSASKYAFDGLTESLAAELAPFGIRVLHLVPGDMRTSFVSQAGVRASDGRIVPLSEPYKGTMTDHVVQAILAMDGKQAIDPAKVAERVVEMMTGTGVAGEIVERENGKLWSRIPIGKSSGELMKERAKNWGKEAEELEPVWGSCDFGD